MDELAVYKKIFWRFYLGFRVRDNGFLFSLNYLPKKRAQEFLDNSIYEYSGVSLSLYLQLDNADSKGGFLSAEIKGVYPYKKIR